MEAPDGCSYLARRTEHLAMPVSVTIGKWLVLRIEIGDLGPFRVALMQGEGIVLADQHNSCLDGLRPLLWLFKQSFLVIELIRMCKSNC